VTNDRFDVGRIHDSLTPPPLFERGAPMWHDPYIATQMLAFHLDDSHDIASRRPALIDGIVGWLIERLDLRAGMRLLDLGCGPGLYTRRFAGQGLQTVGVDYSQNSIDYARSQDPATEYHCLVRRMLRPGGHFVCDVTQPRAHEYLDGYNQWSVALGGGFWRPGPHLVLEQGFTYPDDIFLQQYTVIELDGAQTIYRNWYHDYTPETIRAALAAAGFEGIALYADLMGSPLMDESEWCGVVAG
jgi:hypothetical protein